MDIYEKIMKKQAKITVIGLGYIGLPTAVLFASSGFKVFGYDKNTDIISKLKSGRMHIFEPDLEGLFKSVIDSGNFIPVETLQGSDVFIVCVPTPYKLENGMRKADLTFVEKAAEDIAKVLKKYNIVILESTVPPGTTMEIFASIIESRSGMKAKEDFFISHSPERVLPGRIVHELKTNDRIIGADDPTSAKLTKLLYSYVVTSGQIYITNIKTAELCKLVENTYRDINIAFANELSMISYEMGIDVRELIYLANKHPRVNILSPGTGVGGHCLAVDPWFIVEKFPQIAKLTRTAREINDYKPKWLAEKIDEIIKSKYGTPSKSVTVGVLGLAYKPNIDDLRESPSLKLVEYLKEKGYMVIAHEPFRSEEVINDVKNVSLETLINMSDVIIISVAHNVFESIEDLFSSDDKIYIDVVGITKSERVIRL